MNFFQLYLEVATATPGSKQQMCKNIRSESNKQKSCSEQCSSNTAAAEIYLVLTLRRRKTSNQRVRKDEKLYKIRSSGNSRYNKSFCLKAIKRSGEIRQIQTLCEASKEKNFSRVVFSAPSLLRCKRLLPNCHCDGEPLEMFSCKVPSWV